MTGKNSTPPQAPRSADLRKAIDALGDMCAVIGTDRKIRSASANAALSPDPEPVGQFCFRAYFQRDSPCDNCGLETALKERRAVVTPRQDRPPGPHGLLHNYIYPLVEGETVEALVCLGLELPDRSPSASEPALSKSFLFNLIHSAVDGVVAADMKGRIRVFNDAAVAIFGYNADEALASLNIRDIYAENGAYQVMAHLRSPDYGGTGKMLGFQTFGVGKNGEAIPVRINASIVYEKGREIATIGFIHDMREELRLKKAVDEFTLQKDGDQAQHSLGKFINGLTQQLAVYDMKFCSALIDRELATPAQVESALKQQQKALEKTKVHIPIGRVMIQLGIIDEAQRQALLDTEAMKAPDEIDAEGRTPPAAADRSPEGHGLVVSQDNLTAYFPRGARASRSMTMEAILKMVSDVGIRYGLRDVEEIQKEIAADPEAMQRLVVAQGKAPVPATPKHADFLFEIDPLRIGTVREDGTTDWKDRGELPQTRKGDLLAEIVPGSEGSSGIDVFGAPIAPEEPPTAVPKCGKGAVLSEDGQHIVAGQDGMVTLSEAGALTVEQAMRIDGDIGLETGHIHFEGHIEVTGSIQKGYRVRGHSLRAKEIHGAEIHVAGAMFVTGGIYDSDIKCKDTLKAGHIHKSSVTTGQDLIVEREVIESRIETGGRCVMGNGNIVASEISAKKGIVAKNVGTEAAKPSVLEVGVDHRRNREAKNLRNKISVLKKEKSRLESELKAARLKSDAVGHALGDAAQEQDRQMVQIRNLEEEKDDPSVRRDKKKLAKLEKQLDALISGKEAQDAAVEELLEQDEKVSAAIEGLESDLESADQGLAQLDEEMTALNDAIAANPGIPVVKVSGTLNARTTINGPKTNLTVSESLQRVQVMETDSPNAEGRRKLRMEVMPLRL